MLVIERHPARAGRRRRDHAAARVRRQPAGRRTLRWRLLRAERAEHRAGRLRGHLVEWRRRPGGAAAGYFCAERAAPEPCTRAGGSPQRANEHGARGIRGPRSRDGGAGNRTLVRVSVQNRVYVRRLVFLPSPRVGAEPTSPWSSSCRSHRSRRSDASGQPRFAIRQEALRAGSTSRRRVKRA